jgi:hypothetical protein
MRKHVTVKEPDRRKPTPPDLADMLLRMKYVYILLGMINETV